MVRIYFLKELIKLRLWNNEACVGACGLQFTLVNLTVMVSVYAVE